MMPLVTILLLLLYSPVSGQNEFRYYAHGEPTAKGIARYVYIHENEFVKEYTDFIEDSLQEYSITVDNLSLYMQYDTIEMGRYYYPTEIIITDETKYIDYAVDSLVPWEKKSIISNKFVKGCVFHELTHIWIQQIMREMRYLGMAISPEYSNFRLYHEVNRGYGAEFLEEGICEYVASEAGEILFPDRVIPDYSKGWNSFEIKYLYAEYYVRPIMERSGNMKDGIMKILQTPPPTQEEIQYPHLFYERTLD